jgi:acyl-CoA thioester hydrolase
MIELARHSVQPWECDRNDHLNMQFYVARASDALAALGLRLGLEPSELAKRNLALVETEMHIRFQRELRDGAPYAVKGGVVKGDGHLLTVFLELENTATEEISATFTTTAALCEARDLTAVEFDEAALLKAVSVAATVPAHAEPRGLKMHAPRRTPSLAEAERLKLIPSYQGIVEIAECDANGRLKSQTYMAYVFKALPHIFAQLRMGEAMRDEKRSGAAVEYRLIYRTRPRPGTPLALKSGLSAVGDKTFNHIHWLFDLESGTCAATIEAVSIGFDLETRKAVALTPELRARYERHTVPGLTV